MTIPTVSAPSAGSAGSSPEFDVRTPIFQFGVGLPRATVARLERLRACLNPDVGVSRSQVVEIALTQGGLNTVERRCADRIERFDALANRAGQGWEEYAHAYATRWNRKTFPPTVAALEIMENDARGAATK